MEVNSRENFDLLEFLCQDDRGQEDGTSEPAQLPVLNDDLLTEVVNSLGVEEDTNTSSSLDNNDLWNEVVEENANAVVEHRANWQPEQFDANLLACQPGSTGEASEASTSDAESSSTCPVCGRSDAGKHIYYGARVCISCRGFFRRSVQNKHYPLFKCSKSGNCEVDSTNRRSCKSCRFDKCVAAGMKISWVMSDNERKSRVAKRGQDKSPVPKVMTPPKDNTQAVALSRNYDFSHMLSVEEQQQLAATFQVYLNYTFDKYYSAMAADKNFLYNIVPAVGEWGIFTNDFLKQCEDVDLKAVVEYGFDMPEMRSLPAFDRMNLMFENHKLVYGLLAITFHRPDDVKQYLDAFMNYGKEKSRVDPTTKSIVAEMERLSLEKNGEDLETIVPQQQEIDQYWHHCLRNTNDREVVEVNKTISVLNKVLRREDESLDCYSMVLMMKMLFLRSTGGQLEDPAKVSSLRELQAWQLYRYLKTAYGRDANKRYHNLLMLEGSLKKIYEVLHEGTQKWPITK